MVYRQNARASIVQLYAQETKHHSTRQVTVTTDCMHVCEHIKMHPDREQTVVNNFGHKKEELKSYGFVWGGICFFPKVANWSVINT